MARLVQLVFTLLLSLAVSRKVHLHLSLPHPGQDVQTGEDYAQTKNECLTDEDCPLHFRCLVGIDRTWCIPKKGWLDF